MIRFTILGEPASKANSREIVTMKRDKRLKDGSTVKVEAPAVIKSAKARAYEDGAVMQIPQEAKQMLVGPVRVTLRIFYASERPDLDESVVLDVLQTKYGDVQGRRVVIRKGVYLNDRQVREKHVYHAIDRKNPRAEIEVEPLEVQQSSMFEIEETPKRKRAPPITASDKQPF